MRKNQSFSQIISFTLSDKNKCIEPIKRIKDLDHVRMGSRNRVCQPRYIHHKYPIKNGITIMKLLEENITQNNSLLKRLIATNIY